MPQDHAPALYLTEEDVERLLPMRECIEAVEEAFHDWGNGRAANRPRVRVATAGAMLHSLSAASDTLGRMAAKVYATTKGGARFVVLLFDGATASLLAIIEADRLGQTRTGAASGVATRRLAKVDASTLAIVGTGWQARSQAEAVAAVRSLRAIRAHGRDKERLAAFCRDVERATGIATTASATAEAAVRGADIVVTATSSARPVVHGAWLRPGTHVNAVGSNRIGRRELDEDAVRRADLVVVDSLEQARLEAGDLTTAAGAPSPALERAVELKEIVAGRHPGRHDPNDLTLFKSIGVGLEDLAAASLVYDAARKAGTGKRLP